MYSCVHTALTSLTARHYQHLGCAGMRKASHNLREGVFMPRGGSHHHYVSNITDVVECPGNKRTARNMHQGLRLIFPEAHTRASGREHGRNCHEARTSSRRVSAASSEDFSARASSDTKI